MALGFQYTKYGCRKKGDTRMVHRGYCDVSKKPKPIRRMCNLQDCTHPQWVRTHSTNERLDREIERDSRKVRIVAFTYLGLTGSLWLDQDSDALIGRKLARSRLKSMWPVNQNRYSHSAFHSLIADGWQCYFLHVAPKSNLLLISIQNFWREKTPIDSAT
jgi:hypothetical protein